MAGVNSSSGRLVAFGVDRGCDRNAKAAQPPACKGRRNRRWRADGDRATAVDSTKPAIGSAEGQHFPCDDSSDPAGNRRRPFARRDGHEASGTWAGKGKRPGGLAR